MDRLDIVIFGATGFTGKYAVIEMVRLAAQHPTLTWGVAGRSHSKLESLMEEVAQTTGSDQSHIKMIVADVEDEASLKAMCRQARVLANCCGPYRQYGEPVVRAAIESRCHHVDITGEPQFIESMQLKYDGLARESGVYVISACGFDSIPNDMGVVFLQQHFGGTLNSVEAYIWTKVDPEWASEVRKQGGIHYGTWDSLVQSISHSNELAPLRKQLYPEKLPSFKPKLMPRSVMHQSPSNHWSIPFPGADNSIVYRSQRTFYTRDKQRPIQFRAYLELESLLQGIALIVGAFILFCMTRVRFLRELVLRYPRAFTVGMVSHAGPSQPVMDHTVGMVSHAGPSQPVMDHTVGMVSHAGPSQPVMDHTKFNMTLYGEGWANGTSEEGRVNKRVVAKVSGRNPGYGATVTALLYSAITILHEHNNMPDNGGVITTAVAFKDTSLIQKLNENGMKFEIIESTSI